MWEQTDRKSGCFRAGRFLGLWDSGMRCEGKKVTEQMEKRESCRVEIS
jgi:hypothetical protein